jgi:hypothetical protein
MSSYSTGNERCSRLILSTFFSENIKSIQESSADLDVSELSSENAAVLTTIQQAIQKEIQDNLALLN